MTTLIKTTQDHQFWQEHISQWRGTNLSQAAYCRHNGLDQNSFSYQKRKKSMALVPVESSGFLNLSLPQRLPVNESLTLNLTNGMMLSGITSANVALVKQLALELS